MAMVLNITMIKKEAANKLKRWYNFDTKCYFKAEIVFI